MIEKYEIRNWSEYNAGLKQRGSLTFWISEEVIEGWLKSNIKRQTGSIQRL
ncbi:IS4 family transposase [Pseudanabaena biceps PCC 7429]|uniref:IS4 family transposase n=1 Tax=Pseudanabaena biceps PCC 7429 TaxID=927668 RepID=L8N3K5_9CYAN|nr:IS4 family transposase [Pseudanabaena biceps PCC 7429]